MNVHPLRDDSPEPSCPPLGVLLARGKVEEQVGLDERARGDVEGGELVGGVGGERLDLQATTQYKRQWEDRIESEDEGEEGSGRTWIYGATDSGRMGGVSVTAGKAERVQKGMSLGGERGKKEERGEGRPTDVNIRQLGGGRSDDVRGGKGYKRRRKKGVRPR